MRRSVVSCLVAALVFVTACGQDAGVDDDANAPETGDVEDDDREFRPTRRDLEGALIRIDDIPITHGTRFALFELDADSQPGSGDVTRGARECGQYLDDDFAEEPKGAVSVSYADHRTSQVTITNTIQWYEPGDAEAELEEIRFLMSQCTAFSADLGGDVFEIATHLGDFADMPGYAELGDEGLLVGLMISQQGLPLRAMARTLVRVDDLVASVAIEAPADFGRDPSPELTRLMDERLRELIEDASR